jgi:hypothetical protein
MQNVCPGSCVQTTTILMTNSLVRSCAEVCAFVADNATAQTLRARAMRRRSCAVSTRRFTPSTSPSTSPASSLSRQKLARFGRLLTVPWETPLACTKRMASIARQHADLPRQHFLRRQPCRGEGGNTGGQVRSATGAQRDLSLIRRWPSTRRKRLGRSTPAPRRSSLPARRVCSSAVFRDGRGAQRA